MLQEQGRLSLDDPLTRWLPDYPMAGRTVTVRRLLDHTSGIKGYTEMPEVWSEIVPLDGILDEGVAGQLIIDVLTGDPDLGDKLAKVKEILTQHGGENPVFFRVGRRSGKALVHRVGKEYFAKLSDDLVEELEAVVGSGKAVLQ